MITFPLIGTGALLNDKLTFDPDRAKRRLWYKRVCDMFSDYNVFIGGSSSFDIVPKPFCKLYALRRYLREHNFDSSEAIYFGDDYGLGGNDSGVYLSDIKFVKIDDYRDFPRKAKEVIL